MMLLWLSMLLLWIPNYSEQNQCVLGSVWGWFVGELLVVFCSQCSNVFLMRIQPRSLDAFVWHAGRKIMLSIQLWNAKWNDAKQTGKRLQKRCAAIFHPYVCSVYIFGFIFRKNTHTQNGAIAFTITVIQRNICYVGSESRKSVDVCDFWREGVEFVRSRSEMKMSTKLSYSYG